MTGKLSFPEGITSISHGGNTFDITDGVLIVPDGTDQKTINVLMGMEGSVFPTGEVKVLERMHIIPVEEVLETPQMINTERVELINELTLLGAKVDKRWGVTTLKNKVMEAKKGKS